MLHKKTVLVKKLLFYKLTGCKNTAFLQQYIFVLLYVSFATLLYLNSPLKPAPHFWMIRDVRQEVKNPIRKIFCC